MQCLPLQRRRNFDLTNKDRNFDTQTRVAPTFPDFGFFAGVFLFDAGFGGKGLAVPNFPTLDVNGPDPDINNGFGNGTFSTPPVIEAADTLPAFHTHAFGGGGSIESVVAFYGTPNFFFRPRRRRRSSTLDSTASRT